MPSHSARARRARRACLRRAAPPRARRSRRMPRAAPPRARPRPAAPPPRAAALDRGARLGQLRVELLDPVAARGSASGASGVSVSARHCSAVSSSCASASVVPGVLAMASSRASTRPPRFCHSSSAAFLAASASSISCTRARARLATALFFALPATPSSSSRRSASDGGRVGGAFERRDARVLVVGLGRDGDELCLIGHARRPPRARSARRRRGAPRWRAPSRRESCRAPRCARCRAATTWRRFRTASDRSTHRARRRRRHRCPAGAIAMATSRSASSRRSDSSRSVRAIRAR